MPRSTEYSFLTAWCLDAPYSWNVHATRPWMNVIAPLARPAFAWDHDLVMRQRGQGLARPLGARLLDTT